MNVSEKVTSNHMHNKTHIALWWLSAWRSSCAGTSWIRRLATLSSSKFRCELGQKVVVSFCGTQRIVASAIAIAGSILELLVTYSHD